MKRREFILALGGAAASSASWPLTARAQQDGRVRRIGVLMGYAENDPEAQIRLTAFKQALLVLGWSEDRNLRIDLRWTSGDVNRASTFAKELVALHPEVIMSNTTPATAAFQRETKTIPIVFTVVSDPVGAGFVESLPRPGGNITGFINLEPTIGGKWLELLKEIAPRVTRVTVMFNPETALCGILFAILGSCRDKIRRENTHVARPQRKRNRSDHLRTWARAGRRPHRYDGRLHDRPSQIGYRSDEAAQGAFDVFCQQRSPGRRFNFIRSRYFRYIAALGLLCRSNPARRKTCRASCANTD